MSADGCNLHTMPAVPPLPVSHHLSPLTREQTAGKTQISCEHTQRVCFRLFRTHTHTPEYTNNISDGSCTNIQSSKTCKILPPLIRSHLNGQETSNSDVFDSVIYQWHCKNCSAPDCKTSGFISRIWQTKMLKVINHIQSIVQNNFVGECDIFCLV